MRFLEVKPFQNQCVVSDGLSRLYIEPQAFVCMCLNCQDKDQDSIFKAFMGVWRGCNLRCAFTKKACQADPHIFFELTVPQNWENGKMI